MCFRHSPPVPHPQFFNALCVHVLLCLFAIFACWVNCNDFDPGKRPINKLDSSDPFKLNDPFQPFPDNDSPKEKDPDMFCDSFTSTTTTATTTNKEADPSNFANFSAVSTVNGLVGGKYFHLQFKRFSKITLESAKFASFQLNLPTYKKWSIFLSQPKFLFDSVLMVLTLFHCTNDFSSLSSCDIYQLFCKPFS